MIFVRSELDMVVYYLFVNVLKGAKRTFVKSNELFFVLEPEVCCSKVYPWRWIRPWLQRSRWGRGLIAFIFVDIDTRSVFFHTPVGQRRFNLWVKWLG